MGYDFDKTHELILENAKAQFMQKGFSGASIRQICKDAGVTNGAFYSHYGSKEELFARLVEPVIAGFQVLYSEDSSRYTDINSAKDFEKILEQAFVSDKKMIRYIYENADVFRLLILKSGGTVYEHFIDDIARSESEWTIEFLKGCSSFIGKPENLSETLINRVSSFVVNTVIDSFIAGNNEEETLKQAKLASMFCLAGLKDVLGI